MKTVIILIICHFIGDYLLQKPYIAETKGKNWYHMFIHCMLYILPFMIYFGFTWHLWILFISHFIIDSLKARYHKIDYVNDQCLHWLMMMLYYLAYAII